ncbi:MAG: ABC transporter substrate-binding protein [Clostridiales bacterium]|nr:ABC transporter substrate-binding protein [Clostridiales bacterium]
MKKLISLICVLAMVFALCACGESSAPAAPEASAEAAEAPAADQTYVVGICQLVQHPALDAATQGFKDVLTEKLGENVVFEEQNASGDPATCSLICNQFVSDEVDLIMANATASLQAAASATNSIPILGTSVTDYGVALGIEGWTGVSGTNISGTSDLAPLDGQAEMIKELFPDAKTVGLLYCSGEPNSLFQADSIEKLLTDMGYTVERFTFADSNDVSAVTANACSGADVIYIPTDNTAASCTEAINNVALSAGIPIVCGEEGIAAGCGVATLSISYYDLGRATGEMAYDVLVNGADISSMEVRFAPAFTKEYNADICSALNVTVPGDYVAIAK